MKNCKTWLSLKAHVKYLFNDLLNNKKCWHLYFVKFLKFIPRIFLFQLFHIHSNSSLYIIKKLTAKLFLPCSWALLCLYVERGSYWVCDPNHHLPHKGWGTFTPFFCSLHNTKRDERVLTGVYSVACVLHYPGLTLATRAYAECIITRCGLFGTHFFSEGVSVERKKLPLQLCTLTSKKMLRVSSGVHIKSLSLCCYIYSASDKMLHVVCVWDLRALQFAKLASRTNYDTHFPISGNNAVSARDRELVFDTAFSQTA